MSPAPTTAPQTAQASNGQTDDEKRKAAEAERKALAKSVRELAAQDSPGGRQIKRAVMLEGEREGIMGRITKNRDYLRLQQDNEELTDAEKAWLAVFYPAKEKDERRSKDEIETTRKFKEAARTVATELGA